MTSPNAHGSASPHAHGSSPNRGPLALATKPVVAALLIALPLLIAGVYALIADRDLVGPAAASSSTSEQTDGSEAGTGGETEGTTGDPLARTRSALTQSQLPLSLLTTGIGQLTDQAPLLTDGVTQLSDGLGQARDGSVQLADGNGQLRDGLVQLQGGVSQLGDGATQISGGVDQVTAPLLQIGAKQAEVTASIADVANRIQAIENPVATDAANHLRGLIETLDTQGIGPDMVSQLNQLRDGASLLAFQLSDPSSEFVSGVGQAADASGLLADGAGQLRDGIVLLDDGGQQLEAGTGQLTAAVPQITGVVNSIDTNVKNASSSLPAASAAGTTTTTDGNGNTTTVTTIAGGNGSAANYLLAALVGVGAVAGVSLVRLLTRGTRLPVLAGAAAVVTLAAAASIAFAYLGNDLGAGYIVGGVAFLAVTAAAFLAAAGAVQLVFGRAAGQSVNLILLLVQMVLCGAAFVGNPDRPFFQHLSGFTPLGWATAGLERIGAGSMGGTGWLAVVVMVALLGLSGLVFASVNRTERVDRDRPVEMRTDRGHGFA